MQGYGIRFTDENDSSTLIRHGLYTDGFFRQGQKFAIKNGTKNLKYTEGFCAESKFEHGILITFNDTGFEEFSDDFVDCFEGFSS